MQRGLVLCVISTLGCGRVAFDPRVDASSAACITALASNGDQACALRADGQVWCWGDNTAGQLGDGTTISRLRPGPVQLSDAVDLASGEDTVCAIRSDRSLACWGEGEDGQIGDGAKLDRALPVAIALPAPVSEVRAGQWHTCARLDDGTGYCWGRNGLGQLGSAASTLVPTPVASPIGEAAAMTVGDNFTCVLRRDASAACFGRNVDGELGSGTLSPSSQTPLAVLIPDPITQIAAGCHRHACAVTSRGEVWCWGLNTSGEVGTGTPSPAEPSPRQVPGVADAVQVVVGVGHTCARTSAGEVYCWGVNDDGQLGDGTFVSSLVARRVAMASVTLIEGSCENVFALRDDGAVLSWGEFGELGTGQPSSSPIPVVVDLPCP